jgi:hypothetical protein
MASRVRFRSPVDRTRVARARSGPSDCLTCREAALSTSRSSASTMQGGVA